MMEVPLQQARDETHRQGEASAEVEVVGIEAFAEENFAKPRGRLPDAAQGRDPHRDRTCKAKPRENGDHMGRHAGVEDVRERRRSRIEKGREEAPVALLLARRPRRNGERRLCGLVTGIRNGEMQRDGHERETRIGENGAAPAEERGKRVADRPKGRRGKPAEKRDLRDRAARLRPADAGKRCEGRVIERCPHRKAEHHPGGVIGHDVMREAQAEAAEREEAGAGRHDGAPAMAIDEAAGHGRDEAHRHERRREAAEDERAAPAEVGGDQVAEAADEVIGDAPTDELRKPKPKDEPARDQGVRRLTKPSPHRPPGSAASSRFPRRAHAASTLYPPSAPA